MKKNENGQDGQKFLLVEEALNIALKASKDDDHKNKIYVWRQRFRNGTLSHKKISEILTEAGFVKAVEEKWIHLPADKNGVKREVEITAPLAPDRSRAAIEEEEAFKD